MHLTHPRDLVEMKVLISKSGAGLESPCISNTLPGVVDAEYEGLKEHTIGNGDSQLRAILPPPRRIPGSIQKHLCCWHTVGRGQGCCSASGHRRALHHREVSIQPHMSVLLRFRSFDPELAASP